MTRTAFAASRVPSALPIRHVLLACGVISSFVYVLANVVGHLRWEGYSSVSQTVSELSAIGAPSRSVVAPVMLLYGLLVGVFGWGIRSAAAENLKLRAAGSLLFAFGLACVTGPFTPMHVRGLAPSLTDTLHIVSTFVDGVLMLAVMAFAAAALGRRFALYTIATTVVMVGFGAVAGADGPRIAAGLPTPWVGVTERISIAAFLGWVVVLSIVVRRRRP